MKSRLAIALAGIALLSFLTAMLGLIFGESPEPEEDPGNHSFSKSSLGHKAFVNFLAQLEIPVIVSRSHSGERAREGVVVLAEPHATKEMVLDTIERSKYGLLVLPKRKGMPSQKHPGWLGRTDLVQPDNVNEILSWLELGKIIRAQEPSTDWNVEQELVDEGYEFIAPSISNLQLMANDIAIQNESFVPVVWSKDGVLIAKINWKGSYLWVLSDPDPLANHGLGQGQNAAFILGVLTYLSAGEGIVVDETLHGFQVEANIWRAMLKFPFALVSVQGLVCVAIILWASVMRFGPPKTAPQSTTMGNELLIANIASLLQQGAHDGLMVSRYRTLLLRRVAEHVRAPEKMRDKKMIEWLDRVGQKRGATRSILKIDNDLNQWLSQKKKQRRRGLDIANQLYQWHTEMMDGSRRNS